MKRIGRIAKGERVIVKVLPEDLQDLFNKMQDMGDNADRAKEAASEEEGNVELAKQHVLSSYAAEEARIAFWKAVHERYGGWEKNLGVRDGYALVEFDVKTKLNGFMRKLMKDIEGSD